MRLLLHIQHFLPKQNTTTSLLRSYSGFRFSSFLCGKSFVVLTCLLFLSTVLPAQTIQWAAEVVSVSSEGGKGNRYYSAHQALGVPNAISPKNMDQFAWRPKHPDKGKEHIHVRFKNAVKGVRQVIVSESANPGSITKITLIDDKGKKYVVYENKKNQGSYRFAPFNLLKKRIPPTDYYVKECRIDMNTKKVPGVNIDAIGISTYGESIKIRKLVDNLNYSTAVAPPENLGPQVNSQYADRLPIISPDGKTLYFTRKYDPRNVGGKGNDDIWVSQRMRDGSWSQARNIGSPLNTDDHNFVVAVNPSGNRIYLGNLYRSKKGGISVATLKNGMWDKPKDQNIASHYNDNEYVEYHVSVDEEVLLMAVERKEGFGDRDIYVSFNKGGGRWTTPKNLGNTINTIGMESSAFLAADGRTLYFCSNGHYNYGGLDIYKTQRLDDSWTNWSTPKNMGPIINTPGNDFNFSIPASGEYAYFSSGEHTYGDSDLFRILLPEEARPEAVMLMTGRVVDAITQEPLQADVTYQSLKHGGKKSRTPSSAHTSDEGDYQLVLPYGENMELYAKLEGYFPVSESMELSDESLEELDSDTPDDPMIQPTRGGSPPLSEAEKELQNKLALLNQEVLSLEEAKEQISEAHSYSSPTYTPQYDTDDTPSTPTPSRPQSPRYETPRKTPKAPVVPESVAGFFPDIPDLPKKGRKINKHDSSRDMDLKDLRDKYYLHQDEMIPPAQYEAATEEDKQEVKELYGKLEKNLEMEDQVGQTPAVKADKNDAEVNEMYDKLYGKVTPQAEAETEEIVADVPTPKKAKGKADDVDDMYEKLYGRPKPKKEATHNDPQIDTESPAPSFEELEAETRATLKQEMVDKVLVELKQDMLLELKKSLENQGGNDEKTQTLVDATKELEQETLMELEMLKSEPPHLEDKSEVALELEQIIIQDVEEELKEELMDDAKLELQAELALKTKKKERDAAQKQIEEWKKRREKTSPTHSDTEEKPSSTKAEYVELDKDIQVVPIKVGQVIPMNNIFFDANKSTLKEASYTELERVLGFLKENPQLIVEVGGHTNGWCSSRFAAELSSSRAKKVRQYFIKNGIPENHIQYRGYGKKMPIATNETSAGRKKNQRVELKILEIKE